METLDLKLGHLDLGERETLLRIACPRQHERAPLLFSGVDGQLFFAIPWLKYSWIGTTETDLSSDPNQAVAVIELAALNPGIRVSLDPAYPDIVPQVTYAIRSKQYQRLSDFFQRRTLLAFAPDRGVQAVRKVAELMATELGWSTEEVSSEVHACEEHLNRSQTFRRELG